MTQRDAEEIVAAIVDLIRTIMIDPDGEWGGWRQSEAALAALLLPIELPRTPPC